MPAGVASMAEIIFLSPLSTLICTTRAEMLQTHNLLFAHRAALSFHIGRHSPSKQTLLRTTPSCPGIQFTVL